MQDYLLNAFATLFVTIDPIGLAPMFLALTVGQTNKARRATAVKATTTALIILLAFAFAGGMLLKLLGISVSAFRIAGGLLLFWIAFEMVFERRHQRKSQTAEKAAAEPEPHDVSIFPLAIPLIGGPGAISAVILLSAHAPDRLAYAGLIGIIIGILVSCLAVFLIADRIDKYLGGTARLVLTRLLGVILAALAVQFVADGVTSLVTGAAG